MTAYWHTEEFLFAVAKLTEVIAFSLLAQVAA